VGRALITGSVHEAGGAPLEGARVYIVKGSAAYAELAAITDTEGTFALDVLSPGDYVVEASMDGYMPSRASVLVDSCAATVVGLILTSA
jgi:hypothetical protein